MVLDAANAGAKLGELKQGAGLDILSYDAGLHHLYVQGATSGDLGIVGISAKGKPALLGVVPTAKGSSTSVTDQHGHVFVGNPAAGAVDPSDRHVSEDRVSERRDSRAAAYGGIG